MVIGPNTQREEILAQMYVDKAFFGRVMFPSVFHNNTPPFHKEIYDLLDNEHKLNALVCFRGSAKSTIALFVEPMHQICFNTNDKREYILLCSESQAQSINSLTQIKHECESNDAIHHYFGNLKGDRWGTTDLFSSTGVRVQALGMGQKVRGVRYMEQRPTRVMLDDIESELNTLTPEMRQKNYNWVMSTVLPAIDPTRGKITTIGTIVHYDCMLARVKALPQWNRVEFAIVDNQGNPTWPSRYPLSWIKETRKTYEDDGKLALFYQEYMNIPTPPDEQGFREKDLRWWEGHFEMGPHRTKCIAFRTGERRAVNTFMGVDLAVGMNHQNDRNALVIVAVDSENNWYIVDTHTFRSSDPDAIVSQILDKCLLYDVDHVGIETVQFQQALSTHLLNKRNLHGYRFGISDFMPRNKKDVRLYSLRPNFKAHKVFLKSDMDEFLQELFQFPRGRHDDLMDAFYYATAVAYKPRYELPEEMINAKARYYSSRISSTPTWKVLG